MLRFAQFIIALALLSPSNGWANEADIKKVALSYQKGFDSQNKELIKKITTKKHYNQLNQNKLLDRLFQVNKKEKNKEYEIKVTQSKVVKGMILAHIEDKTDHDNHKTLSIIKTKDGYKVDSFVHMDE